MQEGGQIMGERARALAEGFERASKELIAFVEQLSDAEWRMFSPEEERSVAVMVCHIAAGDALTRVVLEAMATGAPLPSEAELAAEDRERLRTEQAGELARLRRDEAVEVLRRRNAELAKTIRDLPDEELERVHWVWAEPVRTREFVERLTETLRSHLAAIRIAVGARAGPESR